MQVDTAKKTGRVPNQRAVVRRSLPGSAPRNGSPARTSTPAGAVLSTVPIGSFVLAVVLASTGAAAPPTRVGSAGVTVVLPAGWHTWRPLPGLAPSVTDPLTRVVAISAPLRFAPHGCLVAAYAFPATAVALVVVEWTRLGRNDRWPPRPPRFTSTNFPLHAPPAIECFGGPGGSIEFADHGRHFGAYLLAGRRAPHQLVERARAVLDTLRVARRS